MLVYKDLHWWTVLRIYQIFLVKLKIFLSKMQVNTKEILLHPPPKGLANCAMRHNTAGAVVFQFLFCNIYKADLVFLF